MPVHFIIIIISEYEWGFISDISIEKKNVNHIVPVKEENATKF